jgi:MFS family permease
MFTVAAVGTNVAALPIGAILDSFGPRVCGIIGSFLLAIGALLFAFAWQMPFDGYIPGYLFLALGGPFVFISSFQLSNAFPKHSGLILALLTGAFDTSSAVFLIYRIVYQWSEGRFWPKYFFLGYLVVPALILIVQIFIMPKASYKTVGELVRQVEEADDAYDDQMDETTALLREERRQRQHSVVSDITDLLGSKSGGKHLEQEERKNKISGVWGAMHGKSVKDQILSPWFILITLFTVIQMTRINYFVATIRAQYEFLLGSYQKAVEINTFFDIALPLGGVLSIPFIGLVLDNSSTLTVLSALVTIATTIGVLGCLPYTWAAYANVSLFVLYRPFYYTSVSDYAAKVFGFRTFGTVYGFIICLAGLFNFSQSGLDALCHKVFNDNPIPGNAILLGSALVVGLSLCIFVGVSSYKIRRKGLEYEAEYAQETAMPSSQIRG